MSNKADLVRELHGDTRINFPRRKYIFKSINETWFSDLIDFQNLKSKNKNYSYILVTIDGFSKMSWTRSIKSKSGEAVRDAFKSIFEEAKSSPKHLIVDEGLYKLIK